MLLDSLAWTVIGTKRPAIDDWISETTRMKGATPVARLNHSQREVIHQLRRLFDVDYCIVSCNAAFQDWVTLTVAERCKDEAQTLSILRLPDLISWAIWKLCLILPSAIMS
ncbi:hypothetical protein ACSS6W_005666 [Trichoderma asperelloides]